MPPKTRATKATKTLKENSNVANKGKFKIQVTSIKEPRKALADKTNSASEDFISVPKSGKLLKKVVNETEKNEKLNTKRSCRARRLPIRYEECDVLKNLSNNNSVSFEKLVPLSDSQKDSIAITPAKRPMKIITSPMINKRPKRIHKLPNKLNDHTLSPKFSPIKPVHASTPKVNKVTKNRHLNNKESKVVPKALKVNKKYVSKGKITKTLQDVNSSDTNNNGQQQVKKCSYAIPVAISTSNNDNKSVAKNLSTRILQKLPLTNNSLKSLEEKACIKRDASNIDVYEFTFDPNEEPPPKKKKKRVTKKNPTKTKTVSVKSNYDKNLAKALTALKKTVSAKSSKTCNVEKQEMVPVGENCYNINVNREKTPDLVNTSTPVNGENKFNSVRVEDIALQFEEDNDHLDYSPVNSPGRTSSVHHAEVNEEIPVRSQNKDPLNLLDEISFFGEQPVASSSINTSVRNPLASPWRVEFGNLPIKWPVNAYVKPNMTPAVDTSYIDCSENKKKHVYTDIIPETNCSLPQIIENTPNLKQTSIISFIKEVIERSANKKRKNRIVNNNSLFEDISCNKSTSDITTQKNHLSDNILIPIKNVQNVKHIEKNTQTPIVKKHNNKITSENCASEDANKDLTYFGFNDSEDQENISPVKKNNKARALRSKSRAVLHEINGTKKPDKVVVPRVAKSKRALNDADKVFNEMKSALEPPVFPEANIHSNSELTNIGNPVLQNELDDDESQSVHLFEDIEIVHHLKPTRKSYGKMKKVTFRQNSADSDSRDSDFDKHHHSSDEDLDDLSFKIPCIKEKKPAKKRKTKKQLSKKEEKEVEAWAAGFNSMCEDVDEFDLVVE